MAASVTLGFDELLSRLELTPEQRARAASSQEHLRSILDGKFTLDRKPILIGSYARQTQIRMERDIDLLVVLADDPHWKDYQQRSASLVRDLRKVIKKSYPKTKLSHDEVAVVMEMDVLNFDVVPAFVSEDHFVVPRGDGGWQATNPLHHVELMETRNKQDHCLKPLVKLIKSWNKRNDSHFRSLHLEMAVERIWRGRAIPDYPGAVAVTLAYVRVLLDSEPFLDPWAKGGPLDGYFGWFGRSAAKDAAWTDAKTAMRAEGLRLNGREAEAVECWQTVFAKGFPIVESVGS